ncbi:hypothetical protein MKZ02_06350 [Pseudobacillus sp. FSL P4-0506]|uniref:hypothetical protein n=1 Tax=unclassified Pseudobacillus TaxID=2619284 RepID=UPI0030FD0D31
MIDWYVILFLGTAIVMANIDRVAEHQSAWDYLSTGKALGIQKGTVLLWLSFFSSWAVWLPIFLTYHFGIFIGIALLAGTIIALYFFLKEIIKRISHQLDHKSGILSYYQKKFSANGYRFFLLLMVIANLEGALLEPAFANILLNEGFGKNAFFFIMLLFMFGLIIAGLGGMTTIYKAGTQLLWISSASVILISLLLYLGEGTNAIFNDYKRVAQSLTYERKWLWITACVIAFAGKLSMNVFFWQVISSIKEKHLASSIKLSLFCSAAVPFSLCLYAVYLLGKGVTPTFPVILNKIMEAHNEAASILMIIIWLVGLVHSVGLSLFSVTAIFIHWMETADKQVTTKKIYYFAIGIAVACLSLQVLLPSFFFWFLFMYILFYLSFSIPLWASLRKSGRINISAPLAMAFIWAVGVTVYTLTKSTSLSLQWGIILAFTLGGSIFLSNFSEKDNFS